MEVSTRNHYSEATNNTLAMATTNSNMMTDVGKGKGRYCLTYWYAANSTAHAWNTGHQAGRTVQQILDAHPRRKP